VHPMIVKRRQSDDDTTDAFCIRGAMVICGGGCWCVEVRTGDGLLGTRLFVLVLSLLFNLYYREGSISVLLRMFCSFYLEVFVGTSGSRHMSSLKFRLPCSC
jgi:hypothetical protein